MAKPNDFFLFSCISIELQNVRRFMRGLSSVDVDSRTRWLGVDRQ